MRAWWMLIVCAGCIVPDSLIDSVLDADGDGQRTQVVGGTDCDDANPDVRTGIAEVCGNGLDDNCDDRADDVGDGAVQGFVDADGDGFGNRGVPVVACVLPTDVVGDDGDCDDSRRDVNPDALEDCRNGRDDDCDGDIDNATDQRTFYSDVDGDLYGSTDEPTAVDCSAPDGFVDVAGDCNNRDDNIYPGAPETPYDGVDQACDGGSDFDVDGDGVTVDPRLAPYPILDATYAPGGLIDCDDLDPLVKPGGLDSPYDGVDSNCDGSDDYDADGDGFRALHQGGDDCDDTRDEIHPEAVEVAYNGTDEDCDDTNDDDVDGDGFDAAHRGGTDCNDEDPNNWASCPTCGDGDEDGRYGGCDAYVTLPGDCDDNDGKVWDACGACADSDADGLFAGCDAYPDTYEDCDDDDPNQFRSCTSCIDDDGDGRFTGCDAFVTRSWDCNDEIANVWSTCNQCNDNDSDRWGVGASCQGPVDCDDHHADAWVSCATCADADDDGTQGGCDRYTTAPPDCDDADALVTGVDPELLDDGIDQDCDGVERRSIEAHGLFVSPSGTDRRGCGTRAEPCKTPEYAGALAYKRNLALFVAEGTYGGFPTRVSVYGGFNPVTWERDPTQWTTTFITANNQPLRSDGAKVDLDGLAVTDGGDDNTAQMILQNGIALNVVDAHVMTTGWHRICRLVRSDGGRFLGVWGSTLEGCEASEESTGVWARMDGSWNAMVMVKDAEVEMHVESTTTNNRGVRTEKSHAHVVDSSVHIAGGANTIGISFDGGNEAHLELAQSQITVSRDGPGQAMGIFSRPHGHVTIYRTSVEARAPQDPIAAMMADPPAVGPLTTFRSVSSILRGIGSSARALDVSTQSTGGSVQVVVVGSTWIGVGEGSNSVNSGPDTSLTLVDSVAFGESNAFSSSGANWTLLNSHVEAPCLFAEGPNCRVTDGAVLAACGWAGCGDVKSLTVGDAQLDADSPLGATPSAQSPLVDRDRSAGWWPTEFEEVDIWGVMRALDEVVDVGAVTVSPRP